ncbi:unnamed protein product [Notodromas monacha]|uniref:Uncharacterized protein n=1 Tax=Notodromas monacha TaxID=399045 RepID=A0A7R9GEV1_9CRUS|nr:unnamed protein product [Notodromas monacha]CAG0918456.1 unnamed protein product [Notodromas monacha]
MEAKRAPWICTCIILFARAGPGAPGKRKRNPKCSAEHRLRASTLGESRKTHLIYILTIKPAETLSESFRFSDTDDSGRIRQ